MAAIGADSRGLSVSAAPPQWASGVCAGVHAAGSRDVVYVPDNPLSHVLREFEARYEDVRLLLATRAEEGPHAGPDRRCSHPTVFRAWH